MAKQVDKRNVPRDEYAVARAKREALVGGFRAKGKGYRRDRSKGWLKREER
jgi:hypothetical protein